MLYGIESCVVAGSMIKLLEGFHHQVSRRITGMKTHHTMVGMWEWPSAVDTLDIAGLLPIKEYIQQR